MKQQRVVPWCRLQILEDDGVIGDGGRGDDFRPAVVKRTEVSWKRRHVKPQSVSKQNRLPIDD
jgi:hypothetical protein